MTPITHHPERAARVGDWVQARGIHGGTPREGEIIEILGTGDHEHFRVRWDEQHESILYPSDGVMILARDQGPGEH
ncbi:MAG TPA: DUF1918 domain-containing protein [Solirubrobacteraceae bacterium]|nr:DUF1918 domain-containing protein [Solirubrobacteraceae bacterium]